MTPPFDFLNEYLYYNSGNECPRNYHIWSALVILAAAVHKRVYVEQGYFKTYPNLYVGLIGDMGSRKSTAKDMAAELFYKTFKDYPVLASVQSREDIIKYMNSDACKFQFLDHNGAQVTVRPIVGFINELKNFLSVDPGKMVEFLTDIYSTYRFKSSTIKRGLEDLENPCISLLACETPDWITDKLKGKIISGGWSRRIIYVYETKRGAAIPFPERPEGFLQTYERLQNHLIKVSNVVGTFTWDTDAKAFYADWYTKMRANMPEDKVMAGYYESKHDQLVKTAMLLALGTDPIELRLTKNNLQRGLAMLDVLEENMPKLSQAAGRNELAPAMQLILDLLEVKGGQIPEKALKLAMGKDLNSMEQIQVLKFLEETEQIKIAEVVDTKSVRRKVVFLKKRYEEQMQKQQQTK